MMTNNGIELLNGRGIVGYPKDKVMERELDFLTFNDARNHNCMGGERAAYIKEQKHREQGQLQRLFLDNAFMLLDAHKRILGDSRMFLTPVPIESGLAYVGSEGFRNPTLGVYIEWWLNCPSSAVEDKDGHKWMIYKLAGSPLSERNRCGLVDRKGNTKNMELRIFRKAWESFITINCRYTNAKEQYYGFSLLQTMVLLEKDSQAVIKEKDDILFSEERKLRALADKCSELQHANDELTNKFHQTFLRLKAPELQTYMKELKQKEKRLKDINEDVNVNLPAMRSQQGNTLEYQKERSRMRKEKLAAIREYNQLVHRTLFDILEGEPISFDGVERFFREDADRSKKTPQTSQTKETHIAK